MALLPAACCSGIFAIITGIYAFKDNESIYPCYGSSQAGNITPLQWFDPTSNVAPADQLAVYEAQFAMGNNPEGWENMTEYMKTAAVV